MTGYDRKILLYPNVITYAAGLWKSLRLFFKEILIVLV